MCAASSTPGEWLVKGNFTLPAAAFLALAKADMSCCVQTAKRGLNAKVENCGKNRSLQGRFSSCASSSSQEALECSWEGKGYLRLGIWAKAALTVFAMA